MNYSNNQFEIRKHRGGPYRGDLVMRCSGGCGELNGECSCGGMISIELHSNSVEITLPHGCSPVGLLRLSGAPSCGSTSGRLLLNEALLMHHFFCQIANQVSV